MLNMARVLCEVSMFCQYLHFSAYKLLRTYKNTWRLLLIDTRDMKLKDIGAWSYNSADEGDRHLRSYKLNFFRPKKIKK